MIDETDPPSRMLKENIRPLLERLSLLVVKHVLGLECLINRQINRVVRIGDTPGRIRRLLLALLIHDILWSYHVFRLVVSAEPLAALQGGRDALVVGLAEARGFVAPESLQEGQTLRGLGLVFARRRWLVPFGLTGRFA